MLVWEDDVRLPSTNQTKDASQKPVDARAMAAHASVQQLTSQPIAVPPHAQPMMQTAAPATTNAKHPLGAGALTSAAVPRGVTAAEKRIINGQTDVNQLVPFKYKW